MNAILWLLAAAAAGWLTCSLLSLPGARGLLVATVIGVAGVGFGGDALASLEGGVRGWGAPSPFLMLVICLGAIACLKIASTMYRYFSGYSHRPAQSVKGL